MASVNPYLTFNGNCEEAFDFYKSAGGGQVIMPMEKTFWGAYFGMLKDKYGIQWMVNYQFEQPK